MSWLPDMSYVDTATAYDCWAQVYDTDGNFLQALDSMEMDFLLSRLFSLLKLDKPWKVVDLDCGTGRNTLPLLSFPDLQIMALDAGSLRREDQRRETTVVPSSPCAI